MKEIWKDIKGYEGLYQVSNLGNILNIKRNVLMKKNNDKNGYEVLSLTNKNSERKGYKVHRLVAKAFIPNINNYPVVNHKNEIKNDNRVENLEWCSIKYNNLYGKRISNIQKRVGKYDKEGNLIEIFNSIKEAKEKYNGPISLCCKGKRKTVKGFIWRYIDEETI